MIDPALLDQVLARVAAATGQQAYGEGLKASLRAEFPDVRFTVCSEDDIPARLTPVVGGDRCSLYYIGSGDHCLTLSSDAASASGVVVALHDEDE